MTPPAWSIAHWLNTPAPLTLASLRGRAVLAMAFQMLCPGCVSQGLPQAQRARTLFAESDLAVVGLHTVFEHHDAMTPASLKAFLHEYRIGIPVGVDEPNPSGSIPATMGTYQMRGTPTLLLYNRAGRLRLVAAPARPHANPGGSGVRAGGGGFLQSARLGRGRSRPGAAGVSPFLRGSPPARAGRGAARRWALWRRCW